MEQTLQDFITQGVFAFILTFVRIGAAATIMPGIGDTLVPQQIRLYIALGLSLVLMPVVAPMLPHPMPPTMSFLVLVVMEFIIGIFIGTIARIFMTALDTAGMIVSMQSGLGNAQLFNPAFSSQGSLIGAFLSVSGVMVLFSTNLHHLLLYGLIGSYQLFPVGGLPDTGNMADWIARTISASFAIGIQIGAPFIVVTMLVYVGMGVLTRLMPQIQVFILAMPVQILVSLLTLALVISSIYLFWISRFQEGMTYFLGGP